MHGLGKDGCFVDKSMELLFNAFDKIIKHRYVRIGALLNDVGFVDGRYKMLDARSFRHQVISIGENRPQFKGFPGRRLPQCGSLRFTELSNDRCVYRIRFCSPYLAASKILNRRWIYNTNAHTPCV